MQRSFMFRRAFLCAMQLSSLVLVPGTAFSGPPTMEDHASIIYPISSPYYPVVIRGKDLPSLRHALIGRISLYSVHGAQIKPIPFQIDRRDKNGRFKIPVDRKGKALEDRQPLDENDECVFMSSDIGEQIEAVPDMAGIQGVTGIEMTDPNTGRHGWVYALVFKGEPPEGAGHDYVSYDAVNDSVESEVYRVAFSKKKPFIVNTLIQKDELNHQYSKNFSDTMKIRHKGKLLHQFEFLRTQDDYTSRLAAVKDGPVRVIRRTENRVRILWKLRTPNITIDYVHYANAFFVNTSIDVPFRPGWFLSDLVTLTTMDGNDDPSLPQARLFSNSLQDGLEINGRMTDEKKRFNDSGDKYFVLSSIYGKILVRLDIQKGSPIREKVYLMDDMNAPDPPENIPGQFGNVGFLLRGWENLDVSVQQLSMVVYLIRDISVEQGLETLKNSPSFLN